jgi:hypothetical protein
MSLAKGTLQDGLGEAIDFEQDHAGDLRRVGASRSGGVPVFEQAKLAGIVVDAEGGRQQGEAGREDEGRRHASEEVGR